MSETRYDFREAAQLVFYGADQDMGIEARLAVVEAILREQLSPVCPQCEVTANYNFGTGAFVCPDCIMPLGNVANGI